MAGWRSNLRPASFRGVGFEVEGSDMAVGRRGVAHEYPGRDKPYFEDLGRSIREIRLDGFIVGDDYISRRDALIGAIEERGAGQLVHPTLGTLNVVCTGCTVRETSSEGRMARFGFTFLESGDLIFPSGDSDGRANVEASALLSKAASIAKFAATYQSIGFQDYVYLNSIPFLQGFADGLSGSLPSGALRDFATDFSENLPSIVADSRSLSTSLDTLISGLRTGAVGSGPTILRGDARPSGVMKKLADLSVTQPDVSPVTRTTEGRIQKNVNAEVLAAVIRRIAIAEHARELTVTEFDSNATAMAAMRSWSDTVDGELYSAHLSDDEFTALSDLHAATVSDLASRAGGLPRILRVQVAAPTPALVLAYERYEDATRDADIASRNSVRHPGFLPAATDLEVLST